MRGNVEKSSLDKERARLTAHYSLIFMMLVSCVRSMLQNLRFLDHVFQVFQSVLSVLLHCFANPQFVNYFAKN